MQCLRNGRVHIRWMIRRDEKELMQIEEHNPNGWAMDEFLKCLRERNCIGMVAEINERVVGHMVYLMQKHSLALLNIAVHPDYRRRGIGMAMLNKLVGKLSAHRRTAVTIEVGDDRLDLHLWLKASGFNAYRIHESSYEFERLYPFAEVVA